LDLAHLLDLGDAWKVALAELVRNGSADEG
jgi:hypothetical protein